MLKEGFRIIGLISPNKLLHAWAIQRNIACFEDISCLDKESKQYDFLFSIVNYQLLPEKILKQPKILAINYHDSLLPKYPGVHATSWAIFNKEKWHGITWHAMEVKIDAGDILKQKKIKINSDETAFTLNLKCFEQAISSFSELIDEIKNNTLNRKKQSFCERIYYSSTKKLPKNGIISWEQPSEEIFRTFRALDLGEYQNRLGIIKFYFSGEICTAAKIEELKYCSTTPPGTIIKTSYNQIEISTKTNNIILKEIKRLKSEKTSLPIYSLFKENIKKLPTLNSQKLKKILENCSTIVEYEKFWIKELLNTTTVNLISNYINLQTDTAHETVKLTDKLNMGSTDFFKLSKVFEADALDIFLTLFFIYLYRFTSQSKLSIAYSCEDITQYSINSLGLISNTVPLNIEFNDHNSFLDVLKSIKDKRTSFIGKKSYMNDVFFRYPILKDKNNILPISIFIEKVSSKNSFALHSHLNIKYNLKDNCAILFICKTHNIGLSKFISKNIFSHIKKLSDSVIQGPSKPLFQLDLLTRKEYKQVVLDYNNIRGSYYLDKTVIDLFEEQAIKTPKHIAIEFENIKLTYDELNRKANQLANFIHEKYGQKQIIGLYLDRSIEMVTAILAILKSNCAYVPIALDYPQNRIKHILTDAKPALILTKTNVKHHLDEIVKNTRTDIKTFALDYHVSFYSYSFENLKTHPSLDDMIYIIYTSGSTGAPKGVINTHLGLSNRILWMIDQFSIHEKDVFLQKTPYSFDISFWEILTPLCKGAKLIIAEPAGHKDPNYLAKTILEKKISVIHFVPSLLQVFLDLIEPPFPSLRLMVTSGEALSFNLKEQFLSQHPSIKLLNLYGPTEASIEVAYWNCTSTLNTMDRSVPIGKPIDNVALYVLDKFMQPIPIGAKGELFIGGVAVAKGYLNNPTLTKERFIDINFPNALGTKLYKTGDIARILPIGEIEYLGRIDSQVKINGYRIELGEVENHISSFKNIKDCVVLAVEQKNQRKNFFACVTLKNQHTLDIRDLMRYLNSKLPSYMIPTRFLVLDSLPTNQNGKTDKHILEKMFLSQRQEALNQPCNPIQQELLEIWSKVLGIAPNSLDVEANFFELGGDSIGAIKTAALISQKYNISFPISWIFEHPFIEKCAKLVIKADKKEETSKSVINKKTIEIPAFQMRMIRPQLRIDTNNILTHLDWNNEMKRDIFFSAVEELLNKHDALNFNLFWTDTEPVFIYKKKNINNIVIEHHLANKSPSSNYKTTAKLYNDYLNLPIDLENDSLFKIIIIKKTQTHYSLIILLHHLIVDRNSIDLIINSLIDSYSRFSDKRHSKRIAPPSFSEYMTHCFTSLTELKHQEKFWVKNLLHQSRLIDVHSKSIDAGYQEGLLENISFDKIRDYCALQGTTPFIFLLGVFKILIHETFKSDQFAVGFILSKRDNIIYQNTVGPMSNQSLILTQFSKDLTFLNLLNHLMLSLRDTYSNSDISITKVEETLTQLEQKKTPLFNLFFDYEEEHPIYSPTKNIIVSKTPMYSSKTMKRILSFRITKKGNNLSCSIRYRKDLFTSSKIKNLITKYRDTVNIQLSTTNLT